MREIHDDPGEKSRLRQSQQKPHGIKLVRRPDKGHPHRDEPPRDHDACDPAPCTPTLHDEGAGNFQNDVAEGEDACPESNYAIVEAEIVRHLQGRSGKIVAIKVSNHVKQKHIRQKTQGNPMAGTAGNVIGDNGWGRQFSFCEDRIRLGRARRPKITRLYTGLRTGGGALSLFRYAAGFPRVAIAVAIRPLKHYRERPFVR